MRVTLRGAGPSYDQPQAGCVLNNIAFVSPLVIFSMCCSLMPLQIPPMTSDMASSLICVVSLSWSTVACIWGFLDRLAVLVGVAYMLMEICGVLQSAPAQAIYALPWRLVAVVRAQQEYAFGLVFVAVEQKDLMVWQFLLDVSGSPDLVPYYDLPARWECRWLTMLINSTYDFAFRFRVL